MALWYRWKVHIPASKGVPTRISSSSLVAEHQAPILVAAHQAGEQVEHQIRTGMGGHPHGTPLLVLQTHMPIVVEHLLGMRRHEHLILMQRMVAEHPLGMPIPEHQIRTVGMQALAGGVERHRKVLTLLLMVDGVPPFDNPVLGEIQMTRAGVEMKPGCVYSPLWSYYWLSRLVHRAHLHLLLHQPLDIPLFRLLALTWPRHQLLIHQITLKFPKLCSQVAAYMLALRALLPRDLPERTTLLIQAHLTVRLFRV
jgi:hypothetical protein